MTRKGLNATITLIIAIVVMVVIALALIAVTSGNLTKTGENVNEQSGNAFENIGNTADDITKKMECLSATYAGNNECGQHSGKSGKCIAKGARCVWVPN